MEIIRKNNNIKYAWYVAQNLVDAIEILIGDQEIQSATGCRLVKDYMLMCDSDGLIYGIKNLKTGTVEIS